MPSPSLATPRVSIIVPVWNRASLLEEAVRSALAQTFQNFELIIADDGSSDDSAVRATASGNPRISVLRLEHSGSPAVTRNAALRHVRAAATSRSSIAMTSGCPTSSRARCGFWTRAATPVWPMAWRAISAGSAA